MRGVPGTAFLAAMALSYEVVEADALMILRIDGAVTMADLDGAVLRFGADPRLRSVSRALVDLRGATRLPSAGETLRALARARPSLPALLTGSSRAALVADGEEALGVAALFDLARERAAVDRLALFREYGPAVGWLREAVRA